jgi:uncharacterized protein YigE (DUF2233 family)
MLKRKIINVFINKKIFFLLLSTLNFVALCNYKNPFLSRVDSLQLLIDSYENSLIRQENTILLINQKTNGIKELEIKLSELKKIKTDIVKNINKQHVIKQFDEFIDLLSKEKDAVIKKNKIQIDSLNKEEKKIEEKIDKDFNSLRNYLTRAEGSLKFTYKGSTFYFFVADLNKQVVRLHWKKDSINKHSNLNSVIDLIKKKYKQKPLMVTNAGMFEMVQKPLGLYIEGGKELIKLNEKDPNDDNFYLMPNGVFFIDSSNHAFIMETKEFKKGYAAKMKTINLATQSGPMLVIENKIHPQFQKKSDNNKVRNGVGIISNSKVVFGFSDNVNFYVFSEIFKDLFKCKNALFLDGAISKMYISDVKTDDVGGEFGPILSVSKKSQNKK